MRTLQRWFRSAARAARFPTTRVSLAKRFRPRVELLEERCVPATTYTVNSLLDDNVGVGNDGTLRYVMNLANTNNTGTAASPDLIQFATSGLISVGATTGIPLPTLTDIAVIDGATAPGYAGTPLVTVEGTDAGLTGDGLTIAGGSSMVKALNIVGFPDNGIVLDSDNNTIVSSYIGSPLFLRPGNRGDGIFILGSGNTIGSAKPVASPDGLGGNVISSNFGHGIRIVSDNNTVAGNYIGTDATGTGVTPNGRDGVRITGSNNLIGHSNPFTQPSYFDASSVAPAVAGWTGIRNSDTAGQFLITGAGSSAGVLFDGTIAGAGAGFSVAVPRPDVANTTPYGPDNLDGNLIRLVGTYTETGSPKVHGFIFEGTTADLSNPVNYRTIDHPGAQFTFFHSSMGGLAVGNYDSAAPLGPGHAFIYDIATNTFLTDIVFPGSVSNTAYGIWHNGENRYTIAGGWSPDSVNNFDNQDRPIGQGYLVDYDSRTGEFSNYKSFSYPFGVNFLTHFEGISSVEKGVYTLSADSVQAGSSNPVQGSWVSVRRNTDGSFGDGTWVNLNFQGTTGVTSSNSVYGNQVVGVVANAQPFAYQATINVGFQRSNVISGNAGNGITLSRSSANGIAMNYIGTDVTGTLDLGNGGHGIFITGSSNNLIGGEATGGNDPTGGVFVRPPQGNLISGNGGSGVWISDQATGNKLAGNFIGTTASGNAALANMLDGVTIVNSDGNQLLGTTFQQNPFVFYNVISGNGLSGLRVTDSDNTVVHANFFGLGADNNTDVGNGIDGALVTGTSAKLQFGGVIPLGNVVAGNGRNGVEITDTASGGVYFNTFAGLPAFIVKSVPNDLDGFLITSTGGNNVLRTNVISGNGANGVHLAGNATGVTIEDAIIGLSTEGNAPLPNGANGILVDGNAHDNLIGGQQISIIMQNAIGANGMDGIAIVGNAANNIINQSYIGTSILGDVAFGNGGQGIFIGGNAANTIIGSLEPANKNVISGNLGQGIQLGGNSTGTRILGNLIGTDRTGANNLANRDVGILIGSSGNQVGGTETGAGNVIAYNQLGVIIYGPGTGNAVLGNSIYDNFFGGLDLNFGGNNEQPAPVLTNVLLTAPSNVQITGTLTDAPNTAYTIQLFASPTQSPGEGKTFLGSVVATTNASGVGSFVFESALPAGAGLSFTATATGPANDTSAFSAPFSAGVFAAGADAGGGPQVNVYNATTGELTLGFLAYDGSFTGGVRVAVGDVNGDGVQDIITGPGPAGGPNIRVFDSRTGTQIPGPLGSFVAFSEGFTGGVYVAAGDTNGDGRADVIVGADAGGGPNVIVFSGADGSVLLNFMAFSASFTGGVRVAAGDIQGDGKADVVCGPGAGGGPNVTVFDGSTGAMLQSFFAFDPAFANGIYVAAGDTDGDGAADIIVGAGAGGGPNVAVFSGVDASLLQSFFALPPTFTGGVRVGAFISASTGRADILAGAGPGGGPQVTAFDGVSLAALDSFFAFDPGFTGGVFVGGA